MSQNYPLGRIHPHGLEGKSVYQLAFQSCQTFSWFGLILGLTMTLGGLILAITGLWQGGGIIGAGVGVAYAGLLCTGEELEKVEVAAPDPNHIDPFAHLSQTDREFMEDLERMTNAFKTAADKGDWDGQVTQTGPHSSLA